MSAGMIFDCDGTVLDSMSIWIEVTKRLRELCHADFSEDDRNVVSTSLESEVARYLHDKYGADEQAAFQLMSAFPFDFYKNRVEAMPGACAFVRNVHEQGIPCAMLSASPREFLEAGVARVGLRDCFSLLLSVNDIGLSKNDPAIYPIVCDKLGVDLPRTWSFDDSRFALRAQRQAGLRTAAVFDVHQHLSLKEYARLADVVVTDFADLDVRDFMEKGTRAHPPADDNALV